MRRLAFKLTTWLIRKYFRDGLSPIYSSKPLSTEVIAWKWLFYDEKYDGKKLKKQLNKK